jgi:HTH-type transcriptional regulator/antitoxin HigA
VSHRSSKSWLHRKPTWFLIESEQEYEKCTARSQEIKRAPKGSLKHKEKLLLVHLISEYENKQMGLT